MGWKAKLAGIAILIVGVLLLAATLIALTQLAQPIQSGTYEGQTIDYSHQRGFIFRTNDLTTKTHERSSQREDWCVPDNRPELVDKVRDIGEGADVRIEYYRPLWIWPDTCEGSLKVIENIRTVDRTETDSAHVEEK